MPGLREAQKELEALRASRDAAVFKTRTIALRAERLAVRRGQLARVAQGSPDAAREAASLEREIALLEGALEDSRRDTLHLRDRLNRGLLDLATAPIDDLFEQLDDHLPFLLFPVRLETRFAHDPDGTRLRVRIFPDDILISTHDPLLSESERDAGAAYWRERARALSLGPEERRTAEQGAWTLLATRFGGPRARYVARRTRPPVWPPSSDTVVAPAPDEEPVRSSGGSAPPRTRLLPDYFVVLALDANNRVVAQRAGRPIPDTLQVGPDPEKATADLHRGADGRLAADLELAWLIDYERAVDVGMAVTLPVDPQFVRTGFQRVIAIGARLSLDPQAATKAVEELFSDHRFTNGIDLLRQGTPTNNTDGADSGFTTDLAADEALVAQEVDGIVATAVLDHGGKSDAQRLSEGLGVSFESTSDWPSASDAFDVADALAMNRALWPATFGTFLRDLVGSRMDASLKSDIERFFLTYVAGCGLLPDIRVGAQPYGVLATSDLRNWSEAPVDTEPGGGIRTIVDGINWYRRHFEDIARNPATQVAQLGRGSDPLATTMRVVGQLASSVSYASRKAVTDEAAWNTLMFTNVIPFIRLNWWDRLEAARNENFLKLGLDRTGLALAALVFFQEPDLLLGPVIDQDPAVPLSEKDGILSFDGSRNYIHWLLTASEDDLRRRIFKNAGGEPIEPPRALLFRLLYHAWTAQLSASASGVLTRLHPDLVTTTAFSSIVNVGAQKVVPDESASLVDAAKLDLTVNPRRLGDHLLDLVRSGSTHTSDVAPEALPLLAQRAALERIANRPTAVLERVFAEHIDLASYRLDAWQTGLVSRRLDLMRRRDGRGRGVHLGAYGYVEELVPKAPPAPVDPSMLPETLRGPHPVVEQQGNGGFVHAPSLAHAVTAAVLRNGYLTHAEPQNREALSVNLTSRRVRAAMQFVEGMRAGQDLAALLGYQFERGLHENFPGIELDEFIYVLRARFPLVSRRLTPTPDNVPAEVIEARHVIDGNDLLEHVRSKPQYPYDIAGLPSAQDKADAIKAEIARLEETLDAVADLMTAESVHQTTQSNIDRARGTLGAISEGEMPPVPDVVVSPRSGRVFTERVALHLPVAGAGWTSPPSPRAEAGRRLNAWLVRQLPAPESIGFDVRAAGEPAQTVTLDEVGLDAIDVVLMCGDRFGEGSSELERYLADRWRGANGVEDEVITRFRGPAPTAGEKLLVVDMSTASEATPLATLLPQLRALRRLLGTARGLNAQDFRLAVDFDKADPKNPKGYRLDASGDIDALPVRVALARDALSTAADALELELDALAPLHEAVRQDASSFDPAVWSGPLSTLRTTLRELTLFGVPEALPRSASGVNAASALGLYGQGRAALAAIRKRLERADQNLAPLASEPPRPDPADEARRLAGRLDLRLTRLVDGAREILGANFPLQPIFRLAFEAHVEIEARLADPIEADPLALEAWLQSLARVRPRIADLALASAAAAWTIGAEPRLVPVQLPLRPGDPWTGAAWTTPPVDGEIMSVMTVDAPASLDGDLEGLLLDDWTDTIPTSKETTGFAFHFDRPNAAAPQALLLAAPPNPDGRWRWNELLGVVIDTFDRARLRAIEPDLVGASPLFSMLPMTLLPFTSGLEPVLASTFLVEDAMRLAE